MAGRQTLDTLIERMTPEVRRVFIEVMQGIADEAFIDEMIKAIEAGDANALFRATGFTPAALAPIVDAIENTYKQAGETTAGGFPARIKTPTGSINFRFDMRNTAVENEIKTNSSLMITRLTEEARENVRNALQRGTIAGDNPRATALDIVGRVDPATKQRVGGLIGLTTNQEGWVANGRRYLENLDSKYFNLELRDKRFDGIVKKAIDAGKPLPAATVDKLMTAYKNKALKYRADAVARTETVQAVNRAQYAAHKQAVAEGLDPNAITRHWDSTGDKRTRFTHLALEHKYKEIGVGLDEPFISPSGAQMLYPGDTSLGAGPEEIVNCRCRLKVEVDWTYGVD